MLGLMHGTVASSEGPGPCSPFPVCEDMGRRCQESRHWLQHDSKAPSLQACPPVPCGILSQPPLCWFLISSTLLWSQSFCCSGETISLPSWGWELGARLKPHPDPTLAREKAWGPAQWACELHQGTVRSPETFAGRRDIAGSLSTALVTQAEWKPGAAGTPAMGRSWGWGGSLPFLPHDSQGDILG